MVTPRTYVCAVCKEEFESDWSEEEALDELSKTFPGIPVEECESVCDDCFKNMGLDNILG